MRKLLIVLVGLITTISLAVMPEVEFSPKTRKGNTQDYTIFNAKLEKGKIKFIVKNESNVKNLDIYDTDKSKKPMLKPDFDKTTRSFYLENSITPPITSPVKRKIKFYDNSTPKPAKSKKTNQDQVYLEATFYFKTPSLKDQNPIKLKSSDNDDAIKSAIKSKLNDYDEKNNSITLPSITKQAKIKTKITIKNQYDQTVMLEVELNFELDYSKLQKLVDSYDKEKSKKAYKDPKNMDKKKAYDDMIKKGMELLNSKSSSSNTTQDDIDKQCKEISDSLQKLNNIDSKKLNELLNKSFEIKNSEKYKNANKDLQDAYDKCIEEAKKVLDDPTQDEVDKLTAKLENAKNALNGKISNKRFYELIKEKDKVLDYVTFKKLSDSDKKKYIDAIEKLTKLKPETATYESVEALIMEVEKIKEELGINLEKNIGYLQAFYYDDTSILDSNSNLSFKLKGSYIDFFNRLFKYSKVDNIGFSAQFLSMFDIKSVEKLRLGAFVEYDKKIAHNASLGFAYSYSNLSGFARYRFQEYDKKIAHNIDAFVKYSNAFKINRSLDLIPSISMYLSYSPKLSLDTYSILDHRYVFNYAISSNFIYSINTYRLMVEPTLSFGFSRQGLISSKDKKVNYYDNKADIAFLLHLGFEKEIIENLVLNISNRTKIKNTSEIKTDVELSLLYNF